MLFDETLVLAKKSLLSRPTSDGYLRALTTWHLRT